jgi:hypothetical protein
MISEETQKLVETGSLEEIQLLSYEIARIVTKREDSKDVISFLNRIGISFSQQFCEDKDPIPE